MLPMMLVLTNKTFNESDEVLRCVHQKNGMSQIVRILDCARNVVKHNIQIIDVSNAVCRCAQNVYYINFL